MSLSRRCSIFLSKSRDFLCQGCPSSLDVILITAALCRAVHMLGVNPSLLWKLLSSIMTGGSLAASREIWSRDLGRGWALAKQMLLSEAECWMWWCRCSDNTLKGKNVAEGQQTCIRTDDISLNVWKKDTFLSQKDIYKCSVVTVVTLKYDCTDSCCERWSTFQFQPLLWGTMKRHPSWELLSADGPNCFSGEQTNVDAWLTLLQSPSAHILPFSSRLCCLWETFAL